MKKVNFLITSFEDPRKTNSELELFKVFEGEISQDKKQIYYTDKAETNWVFWVGDTCVIVDDDFIMQTGVSYDYQSIFPFLPIKHILEGFNQNENTFEESNDIKIHLESIGYTISFDFEGVVQTITKIA